MRRLLVCTVLVGLALALGSCTPNRISDNTNYDLVATNHDPNENFASAQTFVLPDTIAHIIDAGETPDRTYDAQVLDAIRTNLLSRGYVEDADGVPTDADYVVQVVATQAQITVYDYWGYWGGWWGGYYPGGWYPTYPPGYASYTYDTGTIAWAMYDVARHDATSGATPVVWLAVLNGLLDQASAGGIPARINTLIDQAFEQSPYVRHVTTPAPSLP